MGHSFLYQTDKDCTMSLAKPTPNYDIKCENCGITPTVDVVDKTGEIVHQTQLCGCCCFGEYDCIDPENW